MPLIPVVCNFTKTVNRLDTWNVRAINGTAKGRGGICFQRGTVEVIWCGANGAAGVQETVRA